MQKADIVSYGNDVPAPRYYAILHCLAILTAVATFPLIFMGGLVTSKHAGMSVPDWPNSYGYNMFLFPPRLWVGGILYEHTHRLMASAVGFLSLLLASHAWRQEIFTFLRRLGLDINAERSRVSRSVQYLCLAVLGGVIFQGVLGGLRVVLVKLDLAIVHACVAQAFFCLAALTSIVTSRWWMRAEGTPQVDQTSVVLASVVVVLVYLQLIAGAVMRHNDAGLAIPDLPLAYGHLIPPHNAEELHEANRLRVWRLDLEPVTLTQIWIHFTHRIGAVLVSLGIVALAGWAIVRRPAPLLLGLSITLFFLLAAQVTLGVYTVLYRKPADVASAHVAVGALVLVTAWITLVCSVRLRRGVAATMDSRPAKPARPVQQVEFVPA